ncbi:MAG: thioredoxin family protein [Chitinophagaceae bacterium]|nr:thioredoxin family protein [Chitinophagaceae bacterium]
MKNICLLAISLLIFFAAHSQDLKKFNLYKPMENAAEKIESAVKKAKKEGKHVFIQIGGNWCIWCARFDDFVKTDKTIDSLISADYVVYHLNYSDENKNQELLEKYKFPQRMGYPVFLILNGEGKLIHTQNSGYLEDGKKSYDRNAIIGFLKDWRLAALDPSNYKE